MVGSARAKDALAGLPRLRGRILRGRVSPVESPRPGNAFKPDAVTARSGPPGVVLVVIDEIDPGGILRNAERGFANGAESGGVRQIAALLRSPAGDPVHGSFRRKLVAAATCGEQQNGEKYVSWTSFHTQR